MLIIIIFPPKSIFVAIALSPASLHMDTANSVSIAIPVILRSIFKYCESSPVLLLSDVKMFIIPVSLSMLKSIISTPAAIDMYIANSGLYCFIIIIIIREIRPRPIIFIISILCSPLS